MNDYLNNKNADYIEELSKRPEMSKWREEIKKDANKFYQFCVHYDLIPNIFVLHEVCTSSGQALQRRFFSVRQFAAAFVRLTRRIYYWF